ncbi:malate synthase G, partial [Sinorhizobium sp. FG01]
MNDAFRSSVVAAAGLTLARELYDCVCDEALPGTDVENATFWADFASIVDDLTPRNRALLARRDELQAKLDAWYSEHGAPVDMEAYQNFLKEIGYLLPEG